MRLGLGSFAYRYAVGTGAAGTGGFVPERPMDIYAFLTETKRLGFGGA